MKTKKLIDFLKTGDFSVHYDDNGSGRIVKGHYDYSSKCKTVYEFGGEGFGYVPEIVELLVEALGGETDSV